jgi:serine/threonine protein kinase
MAGKNKPKVVKNKLKVVNGWSYTTEETLGGGGNGDVYLANKAGRDAALKELRVNMDKSDEAHVKKRIDRFRDEVVALRQCADIPGVIPVLDADTGTDPNQRPWFVMGLANSLSKQLGASPFLRDVVEAMHDIAQVLEAMHARGFSHRDIKPDNLFFHEERWTVGDFGLVSFEGKQAKTQPNERIGPIYFNAPEMLNDAIEADGRPADVFSLAKTLWVLATGQRFALPGAYDLNHEAFRIGTYLPAAERTDQLDSLIASATAFTPEKRPSMALVRAELHAWLNPQEKPDLAIKFDVSEFQARIEKEQRARVMASNREVARREQLAKAAARVKGALASFSDNLVLALQEASLRVLQPVWSSTDHSLTIRGSLPGTTACDLVIRIGVDLQPPNLMVSGRITLEWTKATTAQFLLWEHLETFLDAGSEETHSLQRLEQYVEKAVGAAVAQAFTMVFAEREIAEKPGNYTFQVLDCEGAPLAKAEVGLVGSDGAWFNGLTDQHGRIVLGPLPLIAPVAFVAHPQHRGQMQWRLESDNVIQLTSAPGIGSFISAGAADYWPELNSRFELINDDSNTYMYAVEAVIDHGVSHPGYIALGRETHIRDKGGKAITICPRAFRGKVFLINVNRLYD